MEMMRGIRRNLSWLAAGFVVLGTVALAQEQRADNANVTRFQTGQKVKISGEVVSRDANGFVLRDARGMDAVVKISGATQIKEKKSNPFRGAKAYSPDQIVRGLIAEVEGLGDTDGSLAARDVRFTQTQYLVATSVESRVVPVEGRLSETETRLTRSEATTQHLSGQVDELSAVSNAARGGAKAAQETADQAVAGVSAANERISAVDQAANARITAVDDYEVKDTVSVHFKVGSADLSPEAKTQLAQLANSAISQKGYVIEVAGFASADGPEDYNRALSRRRADAVAQVLADNTVPLRRIVMPQGFGENMPVADNKTKAGRVENRRVEVKLLVSKGLAGGTDTVASTGKIIR
jgi:outer membrane protein OmpA-like peptidoglycan-associated protein